MSRQDGDPVPYERQFYSAVLQGVFSLDVTALGRFQKSNRTGFQNISEEGLILAAESGVAVNEDSATISLDERKKRAKVLPYLSGGANQTLHLTDVTPKLVVLTVLRGGNHLFMNIAKDERGSARINVNALKEVLRAYNDRLETDVFIGRRSGFLDEQADELAGLAGAEDGLPTIHVGEVNAMIGEFTDQMASCIE
jgi:CRISPR-associated protein Cst2